jgi:hypothetical protein
MRSTRRIAALVAAGGLVAGGAVGGYLVTAGTAKADNVSECFAELANGSQCTLSDEVIDSPSSISIELALSGGAKVGDSNVSWTAVCDGTTTTGGHGGLPPYTDDVTFSGSPSSCTVTATVTATFDATTTPTASPSPSPTATEIPAVIMSLNFTPASGSASPTPSSTATSSAPGGGVTGMIKGFDGKCLDDDKNSSSPRAEVVLWTCSNSDKAESWRYTQGVLVHNGLCLNDKGNAGSGGKLILWDCSTSSTDEIWVHQLNDTYELKAHNWSLCIDDPAYSKKNGTQVMVFTCHDTPNQHWDVP